MIGGAAGHNVDSGDGANRVLAEAQVSQVDGSVLHGGVEGVGNGLGLLMDFLHHEVLEAGLLRRLGIPLNLHRFLGDLVAVQVVEGDLPRAQPGHLQIADVVHRAGVLQDGGDIRGQIAFPVFHPQDHGAVLPGHIDLPGIVLEHDGQSIGAPDADQGVVDGIHRGALVFLVVIVDELDGHFRIGRGVEGIALLAKLVLQLLIVLDNSVVDAHHIEVIGAVGMGIFLRGLPMGGPAGVTDAAASRNGTALICLLRKAPESSLGLDHLYVLRAVPDGQTGRVISPVFKPGQPFQQNRRRALLPGEAYDSAHGNSSLHFKNNVGILSQILQKEKTIFADFKNFFIIFASCPCSVSKKAFSHRHFQHPGV